MISPLNKTCLIMSTLAATPVAAEEAWQADAFGLYRAGSDMTRDRWAGLRTGAERIAQEPGPVDGIYFIAGPKSIQAGEGRVHLAALVFDADGNLVADDTKVRIAPGHGGRVSRQTVDGIADLLHDPGIVAKGFVAGIETSTLQSLRATYRVTSHLASIKPVIAPHEPLLSETQADIQLPALVDRYGNPAEDGTGLTLWLTDDRGRGTRLDGETTGGAARARLLVRDMTGLIEAKASLGAITSTERTFESLPLQPEGQPHVDAEPLLDIGAQRIVVGPFRTAAGHLLADGVAVRLTAMTAGEPPRVHNTWVSNGMAELLLPWSSDRRVTLRVESALGRFETTLQAPASMHNEVPK